MTPVQLHAMLELQRSINTKVNPEWLTAGYPWLRAVLVEGGEGMDHYGWKWWKKQETDMAQFQIELVDIWHFALSYYVQSHNGNVDSAAMAIMNQLHSEYALNGAMFDGRHYAFNNIDTLSRFELMIGLAAARRFSVPLFQTIMFDVNMNWDTMYTQYVGKNVLNFFRQDHGYKDGTYRKMWDGEEDNVWLARAVKHMDITEKEYPTKLYKTLDDMYNATK